MRQGQAWCLNHTPAKEKAGNSIKRNTKDWPSAPEELPYCTLGLFVTNLLSERVTSVTEDSVYHAPHGQVCIEINVV